MFLLGNVVFGLQITKGGMPDIVWSTVELAGRLTTRFPAIDTYVIGYVLLALGSPAIFLSQFHRKFDPHKDGDLHQRILLVRQCQTHSQHIRASSWLPSPVHLMRPVSHTSSTGRCTSDLVVYLACQSPTSAAEDVSDRLCPSSRTFFWAYTAIPVL